MNAIPEPDPTNALALAFEAVATFLRSLTAEESQHATAFHGQAGGDDFVVRRAEEPAERAAQASSERSTPDRRAALRRPRCGEAVT